MKINYTNNAVSFGAMLKTEGFSGNKQRKEEWQKLANEIGSDKDVIEFSAAIYNTDDFSDSTTGVSYLTTYDAVLHTDAIIDKKNQYNNCKIDECNSSHEACEKSLDSMVRKELAKLKKMFPKTK